MKNKNDIYKSLKSNIEKRFNDELQTGSVIDIYNKVITDECSDMYQYIEDSKNPYLFTNTKGEDLDSLGYWVGIAREEKESDEHYKYRLKDWILSAESSNSKAINNAMLNPKYSSNLQYIPYTHGSGTGTCYIIPKEYEEETIKNAMNEAYELLKDVVSPSLYIEYIVPSIRAVSLHCYLSTSGDSATIKNTLAEKIQKYINGIAPGDYLKIGDIIRIGINEPQVEYFNILSYMIDEENVTEEKIIQELETKFLFDRIIWSDEE